MEQLDKLEIIVERTGVEYEKAIKALKAAQGDVELAISNLDQDERRREEFQVKSEQLKSKVKELIEEGNITRLKIRREGRILLDLPITAGIVGAVISPYLAALGAITAVASKCSIEVERPNRSSSVKMTQPVNNQT